MPAQPLLTIGTEKGNAGGFLQTLASPETAEIACCRCSLQPLNHELRNHVAQNQRCIRAAQFAVADHAFSSIANRKRMHRAVKHFRSRPLDSSHFANYRIRRLRTSVLRHECT